LVGLKMVIFELPAVWFFIYGGMIKVVVHAASVDSWHQVL